jgi:hypothetical protein
MLTKPAGDPGVVAKVGEHGLPLTPWMGAVPNFSPDAPPRDWERQHSVAHKRPIPRLAGHQYASAVVKGEQRVRNEFYFA